MNHQDTWNNFFKNNPMGGPWDNGNLSHPDQHIVDFINHINVSPNSTAIDCGCADGRNTYYLVQQGFDTTGIDISETVINRTAARLPMAKFLVNDIRELDLPIKYDIVIDAGSMHVNSIKYWDQILKQYKGILKGKMFIRVFNNVDDTIEPIFNVVQGVPVYGMSKDKFSERVSKYFNIDNVIYDPYYGAHGQGCHYYYLSL